jgi:hypothetical protein
LKCRPGCYGSGAEYGFYNVAEKGFVMGIRE